MEWPGEALLSKLWESLSDKGIGGLLKPWQERRVGKAQTEMLVHERIELAKADKLAEDIRAGRVEIDHSYLPASERGDTPRIGQRAEPFMPQEYLMVPTRGIVADRLREEVNVAKAIVFAEEVLRADETQASDEAVDSDWLLRWRNSAGSVSSENLQSLWGQVLAGEVKTPGSFALRTIAFLKNLSAREAKAIELVAPFVIGDLIVRGDSQEFGFGLMTPLDLSYYGINLTLLLELQSLGILIGVGSPHFVKVVKSSGSKEFRCVLQCHERGILVSRSNPKAELTLSGYGVTKLGQQIFKLGEHGANEKYLKDVARFIPRRRFLGFRWFRASVVDCVHGQ